MHKWIRGISPTRILSLATGMNLTVPYGGMRPIPYQMGIGSSLAVHPYCFLRSDITAPNSRYMSWNCRIYSAARSVLLDGHQWAPGRWYHRRRCHRPWVSHYSRGNSLCTRLAGWSPVFDNERGTHLPTFWHFTRDPGDIILIIEKGPTLRVFLLRTLGGRVSPQGCSFALPFHVLTSAARKARSVSKYP